MWRSQHHMQKSSQGLKFHTQFQYREDCRVKANSKALSSDRLLGISKSLKNPYDVGGYESKCSEVSRYLKYLKDRDIGNDYLDGRVGFLFDLVSERKPNREYTTADYGRITVSYPVYSFLILHVNLSRRIID